MTNSSLLCVMIGIMLINLFVLYRVMIAIKGYHQAVNGKMEKLIETTSRLGQAQGKAEEKEEQKERDKESK